MKRPESLKRGDKVAIISPATKVKHEYVEGACRWLRERGFEPIVMPFADGEESGCISGSFAASRLNRLQDFYDALNNPEIKAIFCARGGYGCIQLLPDIMSVAISKCPKWLIGFSDISALHAAFSESGVMSLHAPMAKHLTEHPDDACSEALFNVLTGKKNPDVEFPCHPYNVKGKASGRIIGGNLAVLNGLAATQVDMLDPQKSKGTILFIEDIGENIYEIDRILTRLYLAGVLDGLEAILVGQFTDYHEDLNYDSMEEMIHKRLNELFLGELNIPIAFNLPVGHTDHNMPIIIGATATVEITPDRPTTLRYVN